MKFIFKRNVHWILMFVLRILGYIITANLIILPILWILKFLHLFSLILIYEGFFTIFIGVLQVLGSFIYRENSIPYRLGFRTGWFDFRKFAKLKPEERQRYKQEGIIMAMIGFIPLITAIIVHFFIFTH